MKPVNLAGDWLHDTTSTMSNILLSVLWQECITVFHATEKDDKTES